MKKFAILLLCICMLVISTSCMKKDVNLDEPQVITILTVSYPEEYLRKQYTNFFEMKYPHIELRFINSNDLEKLVQFENEDWQVSDDLDQGLIDYLTSTDGPDVIIAHEHFIYQFISEDLLIPLEPLMKENKFNLDGVGYPVIEGIRELGDGTIYALAPTFFANALYYNKDMFDRQNLPYPVDGMSLQEILKLAQYLSYEEDGENYFGFAFGGLGGSDPYRSLLEYGELQGLSLLSEDGKVTINTPEWKEIWQFFFQLYNDYVYPMPEVDRRLDGSYATLYGPDYPSFDTGRIGMTLGDYSVIRILFEGHFDRDPAIDSFAWDLVSAPKSQVDPDYNQVYVNMLMAINAHTQNTDLAWELISFLNSEELSKHIATSSFGVLARPNIYKEVPSLSKVNMGAFYAYKPESLKIETLTAIGDRERQSLLYEIRILGGFEFDFVLEGEKSVEQALADFQQRAEEVILNK